MSNRYIDTAVMACRRGLGTCVALAGCLLLLFTSAEAKSTAGTDCNKQWLISQSPSIAACLLGPNGVGPCFSELYNRTVEAVPSQGCVNEPKDTVWPEVRTTLDIPGYTPDKIWPYYRNLSSYPLWTKDFIAECSSAGCDPAFPKPGDILNIRVRLFPRAGVRHMFIPGPKVLEVRDGLTCTGLPGRCEAPELSPPYRIAWGPTYTVGPGGKVEVWGYEHHFDLYPLLDATNNTIGTTVVHHEFHRGIIIPALMPPPPRGLGLANMLGGVLKRMDTDMFRFITGQQTQPSP